MSLRETLAAERDELAVKVRSLLDTVEAESRDFTDEEAVDSRSAADRIDEIEARLADLDKAERAAAAAKPAYDVVARVVTEKRTYNPGNAAQDEYSFIGDMVARMQGDFGAAERLSRHMEEERIERPGYMSRAIGSSALGGVVVPQYLTEFTAPLARAGRPLADACTKHPLPAEGMTVVIPRVTTGTSSAVQATQASAVSETDLAVTDLSVPVVTIAGQQTVSVQALTRGRNVDQIVVADLALAYNTQLDSQILNGSGASGQHLGTFVNTGVSTVAYTNTQPTAATTYSAIWNALSTSSTAAFERAANTIVMHPRRWASLAAYLSGNQSLISIQGAGVLQAGSQSGSVYGLVGTLGGYPVIADANIGTARNDSWSGSTLTRATTGGNQDAIAVVNTNEMHLWEDPNAPLLIRAEQAAAASLGVLLVVYGMTAFANRYPLAQVGVFGTGLAAPSF